MLKDLFVDKGWHRYEFSVRGGDSMVKLVLFRVLILIQDVNVSCYESIYYIVDHALLWLFSYAGFCES